MIALDQAWTRLEATTDTALGSVQLRLEPQAHCDLHAAVEFPGAIRAIYAIFHRSILDHAPATPPSSGLAVRLDAMEDGRVRLALFLRNRLYSDLFTVLGDDLLSAAAAGATEEEAAAGLLERLTGWQDFLRRSSLGTLSPELQLGLYGELLFLRTQLIPSVSCEDALRAWRGPYHANQDFQFQALRIEVKATRAGTHQKMLIHGVRQLDSLGAGPLLVAHLACETAPEGEWTLPRMIADLRAELQDSDAIAAKLFEEALHAAGYQDDHARQYKTSYQLRSIAIFRVEGDFPRILEASLKGGVGEVTYSVAVASCTPWRIDESTFRDHLDNKGLAP